MSLILLVGDDDPQMELFTQVLQEDGHIVITTPGGKAGLMAARSVNPNLVIVDVSGPRFIKDKALVRLLARIPHLRVIIHSAYVQIGAVYRKWSAHSFVLKSTDMSVIKRAVKEILDGQ